MGVLSPELFGSLLDWPLSLVLGAEGGSILGRVSTSDAVILNLVDVIALGVEVEGLGGGIVA